MKVTMVYTKNRMSDDVKRACCANDIAALRQLITYENVDYVDDDGRSALCLAVWHGGFECAGFLLSVGANPNFKYYDDMDVLCQTISYKDPRFTQLLLCAGAIPTNMHITRALASCFHDNIRLLIDWGAPLPPDPLPENTPFYVINMFYYRINCRMIAIRLIGI